VTECNFPLEPAASIFGEDNTENGGGRFLFVKRAPTICQEHLDLCNETSSYKRDIQLNSYCQGFTDSVINSKGSSHLSGEEKPLGYVYIPHVKGVSEKFKCIRNQYNTRTIFKTKDTLRSLILKSRPDRDTQQMAQCVYRIPCECGRGYTGETLARLLALRLHEHSHSLKDGLLEKSK
jgi:hypothetical protein